MGSTFLSLHYHIVFSTKDRRSLIKPAWRSSLHEYLGGTVRGLAGTPECVGGVEDHVHVLLGLKATHCLSDFMRELKKTSSVWAAGRHDPGFAWQDGYAAFTAGPPQRQTVRHYIENQEEHHRKLGFKEELIELLDRAGVQDDPKYLI